METQEVAAETYEPLYKNGFRSAEERDTFRYHQKALSKARVAQNCATRLLSHRPADWPRPQNPQAVIDMVELIAAAPRKFGTFITRPEARALAFVHALHRTAKKRAAPADK